MVKYEVKKLKLKYRKQVDKFMNSHLQDDRTSYLKFVKKFPIYVFIFCILLVLFELLLGSTDIQFMTWFSVIIFVISVAYSLFLIDKFPRRYEIIIAKVKSKYIESDEVTNAYFININSGKQFTSLSTVYNDIKENEIGIFVVDLSQNRICMVLDNIVDAKTKIELKKLCSA